MRITIVLRPDDLERKFGDRAGKFVLYLYRQLRDRYYAAVELTVGLGADHRMLIENPDRPAAHSALHVLCGQALREFERAETNGA